MQKNLNTVDEFKMERLGVIMQPDERNEWEVEGVLNPAVARGKDGQLYIFPRLVAKNNYSRIGICKVIFDENKNPVGVERMGIALEPDAEYEKRPDGGGGCEDPRITYVEPLKQYIMTYTAFGPNGPRIAMAKSDDLLHWERWGLVQYKPYEDIDFNGINDKDACVFPIDIPSPHGHLSIAMLHRPLFPGTTPEEKAGVDEQAKADLHKESIWISYCNLKAEDDADYNDANYTSHHRLAKPEFPWEALKIGSGAPPVLTKHGWLVIYHGVHALPQSNEQHPTFCYSAGVMILSKDNPEKIIYRSVEPVLIPELTEETVGAIANVVFPTGTDRRDDIGEPNRIDVYYGMADNRIGVAIMMIPEDLPVGN